MKHPKRVTFSNSAPVQKLLDELPDGKSAAQRMATVAERYAMLCEAPPAIRHDEKRILSSVLVGKQVTPAMIRDLPNVIRESTSEEPAPDSGLPTREQSLTLIIRLEELNLSERIALIESLGL